MVKRQLYQPNPAYEVSSTVIYFLTDGATRTVLLTFMNYIKLKITYFLYYAWKLIRKKGLTCPSCGSSESIRICRKYLVMSLMRCTSCKLLFRIPATSPSENKKFYQRTYQQGFTTELPTRVELSKFKDNEFKNTEKNYTRYIDILHSLGLKNKARILDFGCSWGYGSWQLMQAGYDVQAFEISLPRCNYAVEHMKVNATTDINHLKGPFDVFFSSHVLEHVPSVRQIISMAEMLIKPCGYFVAFTPNGSEKYREIRPSCWKHAWSIVHPNLLDERYYETMFANKSFIIGSYPYDTSAIMAWAQDANYSLKQERLNLNGDELVCIAKLTNS